MKINKILLPLIALGLFACKKRPELPNPEGASISVTKIDNNNFIVENTTKSGYVSVWDFGDGRISTQYKDTVFFGYAGTYKIKLTSNSKGGITTTEQDLVVTETSKYIAVPKMVEKIDEWHYVFEDQTPESTGSKWDFKNGDASTQVRDTVYFPFKGTYQVALTSVTPYVTSTELSAPFEVGADDASYTKCNETIFALLTGGCGDADGKTWTIDPAPFKTWVGPGSNVDISANYDKSPNGLAGNPGFANGLLNNEYTFTRMYQYIPKNQNISTGGQFSDRYFGNSSHWDETSTDNGKNGTWAQFANVDPNHKQASFIYKTDDWDYIKDKNKSRTTGATIEVLDNSYIGWFSTNPKYYIVKISADTMVLGNYYADEVSATIDQYGNGRQFTFVRK